MSILKRMLGRAVEVVVDGDNFIQACASDLGFPPGKYPNKLRLRDENGTPRWFTFMKVDAEGCMIFGSDDYTLRVYPS